MPSRRTVLDIALLGVPLAGVVAACGTLGPTPSASRGRPSCVARSELSRHEDLAGVRLLYEEDGRQQPFWLQSDFARRLTGWLGWWQQHSPVPGPDEIASFGSWVDGDGRCDSWHHAGRAFDITSLRSDGRLTHHARIDRVEALPAGEQPTARRRYWQLAAGLHLFFADVLTHHFDDAHRNHVHVDDGRVPAGGEHSVFTGRSRVQAQAVQAVCRHVLDVPAEVTGRWDAATRGAVATALEPLGLDPDLTEPAAWRSFLTAAVERG